MNVTDLRALEAARDKQIGISNDLSERVNEMRESDKKLDKAEYDRACLDFATSENQVKNFDRQIEALKGPSIGLSKTGVKQAYEASPTARFFRAAVQKGDGNQGLEAHEIEEQNELRNSDAFRSLAKPTDLIMPVRNAVTSTSTAGAISHDTLATLTENLVNFGGARQMSQRISTPGGNSLDIPKVDDAAGIGEQLGAQNSEAEVENPATMGQVTMGAYTFSSKYVDISRESITDTRASGLDLIAYAIRQCVRRLGKITNQRFTNGTGTQPEGFTTRAGTGITTGAAGGAANIAYADLVKMIYEIDAAYLDGSEMGDGGNRAETGGRIGWQFHRNFEGIIMQLTDGDSRPLWAPGLSSIAGSARQNMLCGYPYALNYDCPSDMTGGAVRNVAYFGNFSYHVIRDVDAILVRLFDNDSVVGSKNQCRVIGFSRADSKYIGNGGNGANANEFKVLKAKA